MRTLSVCIVLLCLSGIAAAQDLNARVQVVSPKIQTTNKRAFQTLETAMKDFLNGRKWCLDQILPQERIDCNFVLNITTWDGSSTFSGELQVQSSRPVFNSSYTSTLLNILDKNECFLTVTFDSVVATGVGSVVSAIGVAVGSFVCKGCVATSVLVASFLTGKAALLTLAVNKETESNAIEM